MMLFVLGTQCTWDTSWPWQTVTHLTWETSLPLLSSTTTLGCRTMGKCALIVPLLYKYCTIIVQLLYNYCSMSSCPPLVLSVGICIIMIKIKCCDLLGLPNTVYSITPRLDATRWKKDAVFQKKLFSSQARPRKAVLWARRDGRVPGERDQREAGPRPHAPGQLGHPRAGPQLWRVQQIGPGAA